MGAKVYWIIFVLFMALVTIQAIHYFEFQHYTSRFVSKGPRFTAMDGQALCERVRAMEKEPKPCTYEK